CKAPITIHRCYPARTKGANRGSSVEHRSRTASGEVGCWEWNVEEGSAMFRKKSPSKGKRRRNAVPLGIAGVSLAMASGGAAASTASVPEAPPYNTLPNHVLNISEEEIADVSLATFFVFDREDGRSSLLGNIREARGCGGGGGRCGGGGGGRCAAGGGAGRCAGGGCAAARCAGGR